MKWLRQIGVILLVCFMLNVFGIAKAYGTVSIPFGFSSGDLEDVIDTLSLPSLSEAKIMADDVVYLGKACKPSVTVLLGNERLIEGYDYKVLFKDNINAGKATIVVRGVSDLSGIAKGSFVIKPKPLNEKSVSLSAKEYVLGKNGAKPVVSVVDGDITLQEGTDYKIVLKDCDKVGTGRVIINGIGNYSGKIEATFKIIPDNSKPVIDYHEMMLDVERFTIADIVGRSSSEDGLYRGSDIEWSVSDDSIVRLREWDEGALVNSDAKGRWVCVEAVAFGEADVTAKFPNGNIDTCHVKVISPCDDPTGRTRTYEWLGDTYSLVDGSWGNEYVDAYLNNAERMMARHPEHEGFGKDLWERDVWGYWQPGLHVDWDEGDAKFHLSGQQLSDKGSSAGFDEVHMVKKPGELSANDWLLLETSKNQWQYLCHKVDGSWKVFDARLGSAGPNYGEFDGWLGVVFWSPYGLGATYSSNHQGQSRWSNLLHSGGVEGHPSTHGCIALGNYSSKLYYDTFVLAGRCTRVIAY